MEAVLYIHGKGGNADEAEQYKPLFPSCEVKGLDYKNSTPWEAGRSEYLTKVSDLAVRWKYRSK